ncbi:DapH/DapD/GlmU-related protein [Streptococcus uberis]|uniref:DapH/DapD/GlmU-related protein n=1 Tax=Streptococcus uberis TaxID=1349 RepID=UPI0006203234|nr:DapH/DapD/GlmU-related protein [Streptococcus uberis]KKF43087.1 lipopolysaccharide biosynthesis protein [Streptococcus uberis C9359]KKF53113.1 lipopolysaccharide biosynthesis protein [Streptococcus uberis C5388]KKF61332.1 lipopolysaccharide biosynthesis protein [Streptococcus uberis C6344]
MRNKYSVSETFTTAYALFLTKIFYHNARLIRRPFYLRGKASLEFEDGLTLGHFCRFDLKGDSIKRLKIGKDVEIGDNVHIVAHESVNIGNNVLVASKVFISDTSHGTYRGATQDKPQVKPNDRKLVTNPVVINDNVWIGENVVVMPGVTIGKGSIIGANSTVVKSIPENSIAVGSPAKVVKQFDELSSQWISKEV